jgi:DNA (cytosine-5)-methyltransferase 1
MPNLKDLLTVGEAAAHLGVSRDSLRRWDRAGKLKARRHPITHYRLYLRTDLDRFLKSLLGHETEKERDGKPARLGGRAMFEKTGRVSVGRSRREVRR